MGPLYFSGASTFNDYYKFDAATHGGAANVRSEIEAEEQYFLGDGWLEDITGPDPQENRVSIALNFQSDKTLFLT